MKRVITENHQLHAIIPSSLEVYKHLESTHITDCRIYKGILQTDQTSVWQKTDLLSKRRQSS